MSEKTRKELASLPFEEKVNILEKLRERDRLIAPERERFRAERLSERVCKESSSSQSNPD